MKLPPGYESYATMSRPATTPSLEPPYRCGGLPNFQRPASRSSQRPPRPQSSASCLGQSSLGKMRDPRSYFLKTREFSVDELYPSSGDSDVGECPCPMAEKQALEPYDGPRLAKLVAREEAQNVRAMKEADSWSRPGSRGRIDRGKGGKLEVHSPAWDMGNLLNRIKTRSKSRSPATPSRFRVSRGGTHTDYVSVNRKNQGVPPMRPATSPPHIFSLSSLAKAPRLAGGMKQKPHMYHPTASTSTHSSTQKEMPMDLNVKNTWMEHKVHHKRLIAPRSCMEFTEYQYSTATRSKGDPNASSLKEHRSLRNSDALSECHDFDFSWNEHDLAKEEADIEEPKLIYRSQKGKTDALIQQTLEHDRMYSREMQLRKQSTMHGLEVAGRAANEHRSAAFFSLLEEGEKEEEEEEISDGHKGGAEATTTATAPAATTATALAIAAAAKAAEGGSARLLKKKKSAQQIPRPQWLMHVLGLNTASDNFSSPRWPDDIPDTLDGLKESPIGYIRFEREEKEQLVVVFQLYTSLIHRASEIKITRPCWCRYIVDTGLVNVTDEYDYRCLEKYSTYSAFEAPKPDLLYRRAIQYFDAHAHPLAAHNNMRAISDWDGVNLTSALLAHKKNPEDAQKQFITRILELQELLRKKLSKGPSFHRTADPPNLHRISSHLMQVPPPLTITMPEWVQGLLNWQKTYFPPPGEKPDEAAWLTQSSTLHERLAEQECIAAMILEPEIVHWEHIFRPLILEPLFRTYVDHTGLTDTFDGFRDPTMVASSGHMSLGAWMRFCTDFRIYPLLATREEVHTMYESAQCAEREYKVKQMQIPPMMLRASASQHMNTSTLRPKDTPPLSPKSGRSGVSGRSGGLQGRKGRPPPVATSTEGSKNSDTPSSSPTNKMGTGLAGKRPSSREKAAKSSTPSGSGGGSKTGGSSKPSSAGASASGRRPKSKVRLDVGGPQSQGLPIIDYSWMRETLVLLSEERQIALAMFRNLNAYLCDRFLKIKDLCKSLGVGKNGSLSYSDILTILSFCKLVDEEKTLTEADIEGILKEIDKNVDKSITLDEFSRALLRVNELNKPPGSKAKPQEFGENDALFLSINQKVAQLSVPLLEARYIFGYPAFTECLLKLGLKYLTLDQGSKSTAASTPIFAKAVWLIAFLEQSFQKILRDKAKVEAERIARMTKISRSKRANSLEGVILDARQLEEEKKKEEERIKAERIAQLKPVETPFKEYKGARDSFTSESFFCFDLEPRDEAKTCTNCNVLPSWSGWGKGMCQGCFLAHIDGIPIPQSLFYPIFAPMVNDAKDEGKESETDGLNEGGR